ncbi:hypothetical protein J2810_003698 [Chryseobacterium rhizosphaerae]|nr:hypothetical protein [Chryseobacterium rhizosphaerae]
MMPKMRYHLTEELIKFYNQNVTKLLVATMLVARFENIKKADFKSFSNLKKINMNYFNTRSCQSFY